MNFGAKKKPQAWAPGEEGRLKEHKPKKIWITQQKLPRPSTELSQPERYELPSYSQEVSNVAAANYMLSWAAEESVLQPTLSDTSQQSMGDKQCYLFIHYMIQKERVNVVYGKKKDHKESTQSQIRKMAKLSGMARHHRAWGLLTGTGSKMPTVSNSAKISAVLSPLLSHSPATWLCLPVQGMLGTQLNLSVWTNRCHLGRMSFSWLWFDPTKSNFQTLQAS